MTIRPGATAALLVSSESGTAAQGLEETCDTIGVLGPVVNLIASLEVAEALKILSGHPEALHGVCSLATCGPTASNPSAWRAIPKCRACSQRDFTYLAGEVQPRITLCGRDSVQIHERARALDLGALHAR